jgi:hypothetical protein
MAEAIVVLCIGAIAYGYLFSQPVGPRDREPSAAATPDAPTWTAWRAGVRLGDGLQFFMPPPWRDAVRIANGCRWSRDACAE